MSGATSVLEGRLPAGSPAPVVETGDLHSSGVSWGAVIAGAFVAAALALILLALGAGFGLSVISPWPGAGASASAIGAAAILWLIVTEAIASGMGGYLTGRLRTKWRMIHTDEVHFRDTANGFLAWTVAVVISVAFLGAAAVSMAGARPGEDSTLSSGVPPAVAGPSPYYVDRLFGSSRSGTEPSDLSAQAEAAPIFAKALSQTEPAAADLNYLAQLVSARTGLTQGDAERRVLDTISSARQAEDAARTAMARLLLWTFIALLIGAFSASYAATVGGRQRDRVKAV